MTLKGLSLPADYAGHMNYAAEKLRDLIEAYAKQGVQIATHVQGDATMDATLDIYQEMLAKYGNTGPPWRLEHCGTTREDQIRRAMGMGVVCSFFLAHLHHWGDPIRDAMFGPERAAEYMPSGTAQKLVMRASYHSDAPMTEPDRLLAMQVAVTRRSSSGAVLG